MQLPSRVHILEVGPRDGFQAEKAWIPTDKKVEIVNALSRTGIPEIQVTSFVHPRAVPQLADADELFARIDRVPGVGYRALVPNLRGLQRAIIHRPARVHFMASVTESHSKANGNRTVEETLNDMEQMVPVAQEARVETQGGMACAFGCPFEGRPPLEQLDRMVNRYLELGITHVGLADTIGAANPVQVYEVCARMLDKFPEVTWSLHLHNTRDLALANALAAMQAGITIIEGAVGGLGGCPYAPGATGNVATEDLVNMLHEMGVETGIDLDALIAVAKTVQEVVPHPLDSSMVRAGRKKLLPAPKEQQKVG